MAVNFVDFITPNTGCWGMYVCICLSKFPITLIWHQNKEHLHNITNFFYYIYLFNKSKYFFIHFVYKAHVYIMRSGAWFWRDLHPVLLRKMLLSIRDLSHNFYTIFGNDAVAVTVHVYASFVSFSFYNQSHEKN